MRGMEGRGKGIVTDRFTAERERGEDRGNVRKLCRSRTGKDGLQLMCCALETC